MAGPTPYIVTMKCTYAIGDIHGRIDVLEGCIARSSRIVLPVIVRPRLFSLAITSTVARRAKPSLSGLWMLRTIGRSSAATTKKWPSWRTTTLTNTGRGGVATAGSRPRLSWGGGKLPDRVLKWFADLPDHYEDDHRYFVHAGVDPAGTTHEVRLWVRWGRDDETPFRSHRRQIRRARTHALHGWASRA
jgi:hypothetical protein